jgi:hypothetical protein
MPSREELERLWRDPKHWRGIGFYHCPADPRVVVPKRIRWAGWTINFAHPLAWTVVALSIVITLGPALLLFAFGTPTVLRVLVTLWLSVAGLSLVSAWEANRPR